MADNGGNLVLEHLRALRAGQDRIESELRDLKERVSAVETGLNGVRRDLFEVGIMLCIKKVTNGHNWRSRS